MWDKLWETLIIFLEIFTYADFYLLAFGSLAAAPWHTGECVTYPVILNFPHLSHSLLQEASLGWWLSQVGTCVVFSWVWGVRAELPSHPTANPPHTDPVLFSEHIITRHKSDHPIQFWPWKAEIHYCATSPGRTNRLGCVPQQQHKRNWDTLTSLDSPSVSSQGSSKPIPFFLWEASWDKMKQQWKY